MLRKDKDDKRDRGKSKKSEDNKDKKDKDKDKKDKDNVKVTEYFSGYCPYDLGSHAEELLMKRKRQESSVSFITR